VIKMFLDEEDRKRKEEFLQRVKDFEDMFKFNRMSYPPPQYTFAS